MSSTTDASLHRHPDLLSRHRCHILVVDMQEKLVPTIAGHMELGRRIQFLLEAAGTLSVPVTVSEQYPAGLGPTVPTIRDHPAVGKVFEKQRFSACEAFCESVDLIPDMAPDAHEGRDQILLVGIEAHVCVLQTAFDLMAAGYQAYIAEDATGSGRANDHRSGIRRLRDAGAVICSAEGAAFEWCETAEAPEFRSMSQLIRQLRTEEA